MWVGCLNALSENYLLQFYKLIFILCAEYLYYKRQICMWITRTFFWRWQHLMIKLRFYYKSFNYFIFTASNTCKHAQWNGQSNKTTVGNASICIRWIPEKTRITGIWEHKVKGTMVSFWRRGWAEHPQEMHVSIRKKLQ